MKSTAAAASVGTRARVPQRFVRWLFAWMVLACPLAVAASDPSFQLTATASDLPHYFPTQLGNGYFATLSAPRGTEDNLSYMVAFMDYTQGDMSRPAAIPGWSGIDYSTGNSAAGHFWLDQVELDPAVFADYRQVLDLHDGTLTTGYRYDDHGRITRVGQPQDVTDEVSAAYLGGGS